MQGAGRQTDRLISLYRAQLEQLSRQAVDAHALAEAAGRQSRAEKLLARLTEETDRPVVTINSIGDGPVESDRFFYNVVLSNSGPVAAQNMVGGCDVTINGALFAPRVALKTPATLAPGQRVSHCQGSLETFSYMQSGLTRVEVYIHATYSGPAGKYSYCEKQKFSTNISKVVSEGNCDDTRPFPQ